MDHVPQLRIFLASPGDVNEERAVALQVLDMLEYDPLFRKGGTGGVSIHAVAWDKPGGGAPMRATMTPQTAIRQGLPRPAECDIVLVLFWGRMGTPLPSPEYQKADGSPYLSGTEWEFWDAMTAEREQGKPITLLYRRVEKPPIDVDDDKALDQYRKVRTFFEQFRDAGSGALLAGVNEYKDPETLRLQLLTDLRGIIYDILNSEDGNAPVAPARPLVEAPPLWDGSPFPGLRAFTEQDAPIFFGRGLETSELVQRVEASRFVGVIAASGSGKSSLVAAGLIPRLKANAIVSGETGSKDWRYVRFTPGEGESVLAALFSALCTAFPEHVVSPFMLAQEQQAFSDSLTHNPASLVTVCEGLLKEAKAPEWAEILFFIDQFEELFTVVAAAERELMIDLLQVIHTSRRLRCVVTMRSDFMATAIESPALATLINQGNYMLAAPMAGALVEMIKRPAERAGLTWDEGLPEQMQADTGNGAGALALLAYALDELYHAAGADKRLTFAAYKAIGGVEGAIGKRAEDTFANLVLTEKERLLQSVFRELVAVDDRGTATRQRGDLSRFSSEERALIVAFADARLLVTYDHTVEVAHEAIFRSWERLREWIAEAQEDLILLRQVRTAAEDWHKRERPDFLLWPQERLTLVYAMMERLKRELSEIERDFIEPEQERLYRELETLPKDGTSHERRRDIGDRLAVIGDTRPGVGVKDGLLDVAWLPVSGGNFRAKIESSNFLSNLVVTDDGDLSFEVKPFFIAKYQITYAQFQVFVEADDGFENDVWWLDMPNKYQKQTLSGARSRLANAPRDSVSWYQSVAFARWMNHKLNGSELTHPDGALRVGDNAEIRLPTEWEWEWAAMAGREIREYPWTGGWSEGYANTSEAGLSRSVAVGMYPHGAAVCGALDMAGNLYEWCQNDRDDPTIVEGYSNEKSKVLRGGSFGNLQINAAASFRYYGYPNYGFSSFGVRLVLAAPISAL